MAAASNIVLADSVPANHTFEPIEVDPANALFLQRATAATSAGFEALRLTFSRSSSGRPTNRIGIRLDVPYEQTVDGVTTVYDTARMQTTITCPEKMTAQQRLDFATLIQSAMAHATVKAYTSTLSPVW